MAVKYPHNINAQVETPMRKTIELIVATSRTRGLGWSFSDAIREALARGLPIVLDELAKMPARRSGAQYVESARRTQ